MRGLTYIKQNTSSNCNNCPYIIVGRVAFGDLFFTAPQWAEGAKT
jgi:hypothetical protein